MGISILAGLYKDLTGDDTWESLRTRLRSWALGANGWGVSYVMGSVFDFTTGTFVRCPHHQIANLVGSLNGQPPILFGGTSNGPSLASRFSFLGTPEDARECPPDGSDFYLQFNHGPSRFRDYVGAWPCVEVADDYTAGSLLLFAQNLQGV